LPGNAAPDPLSTCDQTAQNACDTESTPVAKSGCSAGWQQLAGAVFPGTDTCGKYSQSDSVTPVTADFFAVRFPPSNATSGLAVGAQCINDPPPDTTGSALDSYLDGCEREPVLYQYTTPRNQPGRWSASCLGDCNGHAEPGYVAAIAWIDGHTALAVGGDSSASPTCPASQSGCGGYPRREPDPALAAGAPDPAGHARAWLYQDGSWREITASLPANMGALTAVDCSPDDSGVCIAGGLRELWTFHKDHFDSTPATPTAASDNHDPTSADTENALVDGGLSWHFRVREIRFNPDPSSPQIQAVAVTDGCCSPDQTAYLNTPRVLVYDGSKWYVRLAINDPAPSAPAAQRATIRDHYPPQSELDSFYGLIFIPQSAMPEGSEFGDHDPYSGVSVLAADGGHPSSEPASRIFSFPMPYTNGAAGYVGFYEGSVTFGLLFSEANAVADANLVAPPSDSGDLTHELSHPTTSSARLVSGDGDFTGPPYLRGGGSQLAAAGETAYGGGAPDGLIDWGVGSFLSAGPGEAAGQGAAYTTTRAGGVPTLIQCPAGTVSAGCSPDTNRAAMQGQTQSQSLFALSSYALNSTVVAGDSGQYWAVGDRGAIVTLGGQASLAVHEPPPPRLGSPAEGSAASLDPYAPFAPGSASGSTGAIPALDDEPLQASGSPGFEAAGPADPTQPTEQGSGTAEDISQIVMSADGSQGWAIGPGDPGGTDLPTTPVMTLYHYSAGHWSRCDTDGIAGVLAPDPACASLAALRRYRGSGGFTPVTLHAIARIPTEDSTDPSVRGDFEALAFGSSYADAQHPTPRSVVLRYAHGRWFVDWQSTQELDDGLQASGDYPAAAAFTSPEDGWAVTAFSSRLFHFDGRHWTDCTATSPEPSACGEVPTFPANGNTSLAMHLTTAGERVYLYGVRVQQQGSSGNANTYPVIIAKDPGRPWGAAGSYDPGAAASPDPSQQGDVDALSVVRDASGGYHGWAVGAFGTTPGSAADQYDSARRLVGTASALLRLGSDGAWSPWSGDDAASEYLLAGPANLLGARLLMRPAPRVLTLPQPLGDVSAVAAPGGDFSNPTGPMLGFSQSRQRWEVLPTPWAHRDVNTPLYKSSANLRAIAPDGQGGFWVAARRVFSSGPVQTNFFYDFTTAIHRPVFADVPHPIREEATAAAAGPGGTLWVAVRGGVVYRYDRIGGWDRVIIPGWDAGSAVTAASPAHAVAVGANGEGVLVGAGGRIADLSPAGVRLDPAAGIAPPACLPSVAPCGTGQDLDAAAVAPDGSALVGGADRALLWRQAGGGFRPIAKPPAAPNATITGIAMPQPDRAWLTDDNGEVYAGALQGGDWSWQLEDTAPDGTLLSLGRSHRPVALRAIAIAADGHGFAVGDGGVILQRAAGGGWRRLDAGYLDNLTSVALSPGGGSAALVGGWSGLILTYEGGVFRTARPADPYNGIDTGESDANSSRIVGLAIEPGYQPDQVEAWAIDQVPGIQINRTPPPTAVLHYSSDLSNSLLDGGVGRVAPLPDAPPAQPGELRLAAFGKSDCQLPDSESCPPDTGSNIANELLASRIVEQLRAQSPQLLAALFTGDIDNTAGSSENSVHATTPIDVSFPAQNWSQLVAQPLEDAGLPVFGALGSQDLSHTQACPTTFGCAGTRSGGVAPSFGWRSGLAGLPAPWGSGSAPAGHDGLSYRPLDDGAPAAPSVSTPSVSSPAQVRSLTVGAGGARTHYAFDVDQNGSPVLRVVVVDTSLKTLSTAAGEENPVESQLTWLTDVLSKRPGRERAVVVSETPPYTYGPGSGADTLLDSQAFETLMGRYGVSAVVSGRLGWNGLYYTSTLAPGLHCPQPGGSYPDPSAVCSPTSPGGQAQQQATGRAGEVLAGLAGTLSGAGAPAAPPPNTALGAYPTVISASAGGKFGPSDQSSTGSADQGYWHGYSILRLEPDGSVTVEQRPVFDWIGINAIAHTLEPGQHVQLHGYGREPVGTDAPIQYDDINSPAITHRYDLVQADPAVPWLPKVDSASPAPNHYVPIDPSVATVDRQTGFVQTGSGSHPRVYAIAILSVGDKATSWPIAFEPRRNFAQRASVLPQLPPVVPPVQTPPIHVAAAAPTPPPPPSSAPPTPPEVGTPSLPQLPSLSPPPPIAALPGPSAPPPPAPPPPPPAQPQPLPLALQAKLSPVGINATVVPPSPPPVNPAPPSGSAARKEAKQRQAATAKSEEGATEPQDSGVDLADKPRGVDAAQMTRVEHPMTRRERLRPAISITLAAHRSQPSAWSRDLLYGGALGGAAFVLALSFATARPTPRRREPRLPAPAGVRRVSSGRG
jgi:hypothetical protein